MQTPICQQKRRTLSLSLFFPGAPSLFSVPADYSTAGGGKEAHLFLGALLPQLSAQLFNFSSILEKKKAAGGVDDKHAQQGVPFVCGRYFRCFVLRGDLAWKTFVLTLDLLH
jgi:hypothetical protein